MKCMQAVKAVQMPHKPTDEVKKHRRSQEPELTSPLSLRRRKRLPVIIDTIKPTLRLLIGRPIESKGSDDSNQYSSKEEE
ncbi:MAG: hypothetical protein ACE5Z5_02680 [Candidatus Bathyarchaeia archaeon]